MKKLLLIAFAFISFSASAQQTCTPVFVSNCKAIEPMKTFAIVRK
jgi:hypothetical protein